MLRYEAACDRVVTKPRFNFKGVKINDLFGFFFLKNSFLKCIEHHFYFLFENYYCSLNLGFLCFLEQK